MMHALLQYQKTDGVIRSLWHADPVAMLLSQVQAADPSMGYAVLDTELPAEEILTNYCIRNGDLTPKTLVTITADPTPFPADGHTVCQISVTPFLACTVVIGTTPLPLTLSDPVLELTADTPQTWTVRLAPMPEYRAVPIKVEAT